jgi:hypothetical protein
MLDLLSVTQTGMQMRANLYANVFTVEHEQGFAEGAAPAADGGR